jgi:16S rRNA pseudouridine516 synthase
MLEGEEKPLLPAELAVIDPHHARLTITEGRYHQVRRMFAAAGNHVNELHRERIGGLPCRPISSPASTASFGAEAERVFGDV